MRISDLWNESSDVFIIAEVAQNHDGSLGQAHAFIDALANTGVDAVKFQTHFAEEESTIYEPFRVKFSFEDKTRYDYWKRMEFSQSQWKELKEHSEKEGMTFLSSPFSLVAVKMLDELGIEAWKLGSGEVFNLPIMEKIVETEKPVLISSGMSSFEEIDKQIDYLKKCGNKYALFQCTTMYPTTYDRIGLNVLSEMISKYKCPIGLSDHSGTIYPSLAAVTLGAKVVEVHVTLSKYMFGPDVSSSLEIEDLKRLVEGVRAISMMRKNPYDKKVVNPEQDNLKHIFSKGIYLKRDMREGEEINIEDISFLKPSNGISANEYKKVIGKRIKRNISKGDALKDLDI